MIYKTKLNLNGLLLVFFMAALSKHVYAQTPASFSQRKILSIPDIPGYKTLKCDFHIHTVFSDGEVWPTVRVREAWVEGLDAIAITDHIEYLPHKQDIEIKDYNRSYEIAMKEAKNVELLLVKAAEITRPMPPGHFNALFIEDPNLLQDEDVYDVLKEAKRQGAFLLWDHPGWKPMAPNGIKWYDEHTWLLENGLLDGIEVYNDQTYYPEALKWAIDKKLSIFCDTDIHGPIALTFDIVNSHRPMTLVFAKEKTKEALKEALFAKRSVAYFDNTVVGSAEWLEPLFFASIQIEKKTLNLDEEKEAFIEIKNISDFDFELELLDSQIDDILISEKITVSAHHSTNIRIAKGTEGNIQAINAIYKVNNFYTAPDTNLSIELNFNP